MLVINLKMLVTLFDTSIYSLYICVLLIKKIKVMKIEFIYTYKEGSQDIIQYPFVPQILENPETLSDFATAMSSEFEVSKLVKISCCVYLEYRTGIEFPEWYNRCNGKLWYTDGKLELER